MTWKIFPSSSSHCTELLAGGTFVVLLEVVIDLVKVVEGGNVHALSSLNYLYKTDGLMGLVLVPSLFGVLLGLVALGYLECL